MKILAVNCGSSSVKSDVIDCAQRASLLDVRVQRINSENAQLEVRRPGQQDAELIPCEASGYQQVLEKLFAVLAKQDEAAGLSAVVHRVVHGGERFQAAVQIDQEVISEIDRLAELAPLHNPANLAGIRAAQQAFSELPQIAVFDTAFHARMPRRAKTYALPKEINERFGFRRFGFHGTSHRYVAQQAATFLQSELGDLRLITCHLGNGCSVAAVEYGTVVETSMGFTPLEGLVMGTRCGDLDPGILLTLQRDAGMSAEQLDTLLNKESGLRGLSGRSGDMRDIESAAAAGDEDCRLAINVFCHRVKKYIGAYAAVLGGVDAVVFTGGIGENSAAVRHRIAQRLDFLGAVFDEELNRELALSEEQAVQAFSSSISRVKLLAVATDEQLAMAEDAAELLQREAEERADLQIPIGVSSRHVHLTQETVEQLFGKGAKLTERNPLSQPGQFAANECVTLIGPKARIENVRILGPVRSQDQVEIARTDEYRLGVDAPVRESGNLDNTPGITLEGPNGQLTLSRGLICAWRHIHMTPEDAERLGVTPGEVVSVEVDQAERGLTFQNVLIRVSPKYRLEMHIDTDEANAAEITQGMTGRITR